MNVIQTKIPDVLLIEPKVFGDERGFFFESYSRRAFEKATGIKQDFVQDNHSRSSRNVLRGLHFQMKQAQGKLITIIEGAVQDVVVDLRKSSASFGKHVTIELSSENKRMLWVPKGFAHGFMTLSEHAYCVYKTTDYYAPEHEQTIAWNDPDLAIAWKPADNYIISQKDRNGLSLKNAPVYD